MELKCPKCGSNKFTLEVTERPVYQFLLEHIKCAGCGYERFWLGFMAQATITVQKPKKGESS